jgi:WD40 repeat protein
VQDSRLVLSPDGNRIAFAARDRIWTVAVIDLKAGSPYTTVRNLIFGPGGNYYYLAQKGNAWLLVADGKEGKPYDGISELALLPKTARPLFIATDKERNLLVVDDRESRRWRQVTEVTFTPGDSLAAYVAEDSNRWYVVEDTVIRIREPGILLHSLSYKSGTREPVYVAIDAAFSSVLKVDGLSFSESHANIERVSVAPDGRYVVFQTTDSAGREVWVNHAPVGIPTGIVGSVVFSPDSRRYAFVTQSDSGMRVISDSGASRLYDDVSELQFSPDGLSLAWIARRAGASFAVESDQEGPHYDAVGYLKFAPTTGRLAHLAVQGNEAREVVAGQPGKAWDDVGPALFSPDGTRIAYPTRQGNSFYLVCTSVP